MHWALSTSTGPGGGTASHVTVTLLGSSQGYPWTPCPMGVTASCSRKTLFSPELTMVATKVFLGLFPSTDCPI